MAADRAYFVGEAQAHPPPRQIHLMDTLVSQIAIAVVPKPVPVVVEAIFRKCVLRRRSSPQIVVNALRNWPHGRLPDGVPPLIAESTAHIRIPDHALPQLLHRLANGYCGAA